MFTTVPKRVFAILLSIIMLSAPFIECVYAAENTTDIDTIEKTCPTIFIHGFACGDIYSEIGTENESIVWPMQGETITQAIKTAIAPVASYLLTHNCAAF